MHSMTAFANYETETPLGVISCEIKSVNQRFLDISIRAPEFVRQEEERIRKLLAENISRGKVSVFIRFYPKPEVALNDLKVNHSVLDQLKICSEEIRNTLKLEYNDLSISDYMRWNDVIIQAPGDTSSLVEYSMTAVGHAVNELQLSRQREGQGILLVLKEQTDRIEKLVSDITKYVPEINQVLQEKMLKKLEELDIEANPERFEQELAYQLQRIDITEELDRLRVHVQEVRRVLGLQEPVGRRLDFLIQELNREANTIGSKSVSVMTSNSSIDLKVAIEQMREQIQNIE